MKIYGASPALISRFRFLLLLFFFFCKRAYDKQRGGGLLEKHRIRIPRWKRRMHVTTSYVPFPPLIFPQVLWIHKVQPRASNTCSIPNHHIIRGCGPRCCYSRQTIFSRQWDMWWVSEKEGSRLHQRRSNNSSINSSVTNSDGNSYG